MVTRGCVVFVKILNKATGRLCRIARSPRSALYRQQPDRQEAACSDGGHFFKHMRTPLEAGSSGMHCAPTIHATLLQLFGGRQEQKRPGARILVHTRHVLGAVRSSQQDLAQTPSKTSDTWEGWLLAILGALAGENTLYRN